uniref:C2H2-type domain-containing protein n=1 Tax=Meloidogyne hapla TaxID=6305 RepID=A0A1I8B920_MELHA
MKEKHSDQEVLCLFCLENQTHPKLARGETYSCGYKPYRCELCKYSTTTKGNLSIHMQSDKHLHALQEIPQSLAAAAVAAAAGSSQLIIGNNQFNNYSTQELDISTNSTTNNSKIIGGALQCLICFNFYTDISELMVEHLEKDRSQTQECDISTINGYFQCLICPYSTNLKANFQLHTRTDKHLQRIQMINHLREGISGLFGQSEQFARLGTLKSAVQVRCQECEEILSCIPTLREHCQSNSHQIRMISNGRCLQNQSPFEKENILEYFLNNSLIFCGICDWEGNGKEIVSLAFEHANTHFEKSNEYSKKNDISINQTDTNKEEKINDIKNNKNNKINDNIEEEDNLIGWKQLDKYLIDAGLAKYMKSEENIEENNKNNNVDTLANQIISLQTLGE